MVHETIRAIIAAVVAGAACLAAVGRTATAAGPVPAEKHWSFAPPRTPAVPQVKRADWPRTDVDRFILSALEAKGLAPAAQADKLTLIRRATFDLTGLPPTPEEVEAYLKD